MIIRSITRRNLRLMALAAASIVVVMTVGGCGGGSEEPTSVSTADLEKDGEFWNSLNDDLQRELAGICQDEETKEAENEQVALFVQEQDVDDYVAELNKQYDEGSEATIAQSCETAREELARSGFEAIAPQLGGE